MDEVGPPLFWPALMDRRTAAAYLAVAPATLPRLLARQGVQPLELGLRLRRWRKSDLDALLARLPLRSRSPFDEACANQRDGLDCALAAVEARISRGRRHEKRGER